jgi:hypothetical protein
VIPSKIGVAALSVSVVFREFFVTNVPVGKVLMRSVWMELLVG